MRAERADVTVSLAAGLAGAALLVPPVTAWVLATAGVDVAALTAIIGGSVIVTLAAVGFSRYGAGIPVQVGSTPWSYLLALVPIVPLLAMPAWTVPRGARALLVLGAIFGLLATLAFVLACQTRHANAVTPPDVVSWSAPPPERVASRRRTIGVAAFAIGLALFGGGIAAGQPPARYVGQLLVPVAAVVTVSATRTGDYAAGPAGLTRRTPAHAVTRPWHRFRGYSVTDDAIVLHRAPRWRWLPAIRFARAGLDEPAVVVDVLDAHLSRVAE